MFDFILSQFKVGDSITLHCKNGSYTGTIAFMNKESIALKLQDGRLCGVKGEDINFFEEVHYSSTEKVESQKSSSSCSDSHTKQEELSSQKESAESSKAEGKDESSCRPDVSRAASVPGTKYNVGDVIPLEELQRIDPNYSQRTPLSTGRPSPKAPSKTESQPSATSSSAPLNTSALKKSKSGKTVTIKGGFEGLAVLVQDKHQNDNQKVVPANGTVSHIDFDRNFGFIKDLHSNASIYFSLNQIIDPGLKQMITRHSSVVFTIEHFSSGDQAWYIHRPLKVADLLEMAKSLSDTGNYKQSLAIVDHILAEYPDNFDADVLRMSLSKSIPASQRYVREYSNAYTKAKEYHNNKEFDKAIEYYLKAIEKGIRVESAIKDVASLYASLYKSEEDYAAKENIRKTATQFLARNVNKLHDNLSTWNFLEGIYYTLKDTDNFIAIVDRMLEEPEIIRDKKRRNILMNKKAAAYVRDNRYDEALSIIAECLLEDPNDPTALKLHSIVSQGDKGEGDIEAIVSADDFFSLQRGISPFIQETLREYEEYVGVPAKVIEAGNFTPVTLKGIRNLIDTVGRARARERAKYLLTEGKLMLELEPDNVVKLRSEMARYCVAMALNHISDYSSMDIPRFYYTEAFSLEDTYPPLSRAVSSYLLTLCYSNAELMSASGKDVSLDEALSKTIEGVFEYRRWDSILSMLLVNTEISAQITSRLFSKSTWKSKAIQALHYYGVKTDRISDQESFVKAWNEAREIRIRDYKQVDAQIKAIGASSNIEEVSISLLNLQQIKKDWMTAEDMRRINIIIHNIQPAIENYIKSSGYRNKETNYNNSQGQVQQLLDEIKTAPTRLSYESLSPLLSKVQSLLTSSFKDVIKASEPRITISLLSSETVISDKSIVHIQVSISNHKDSSPIREVSVEIESSDDVIYIPSENTSYNAIEGGESQIFRLGVKVSPGVIASKATAINAVCKYKNGDVNKEEKALLSLKLYSPDEFTPIENPYAPIADGGPVPVSSKMFFGREDFISNIVEAITKSPSKQIIIYGQKRCGKSSVMLHLKKQLQETGKTFCVFFSLGDIIQNLTEAAFYHKILSSIKDELDSLEFDGFTVPDFSVPRMADFRAEDEDNPLNTFTSYMVKFKRACKTTPGWEDKNLVVMIDEFTYLYTEIKEEHISPSIMKQWKAVTQNERAQFSVVLVGQDVVPSFKKEDYARNAFGVIQDIRLTYLQDEPARALIEQPILDENGNSRYIGNAVARIIEYTSRNPYYIQIFCARLVDYMNSNKSITVTEADINEVAKSFVVGDQALEEDKFDNLIRAGEKEDLQEYPEKEIRTVLREIANASKHIGFCNRTDLNALDNREREDDILKHLVDREVLEKRGEETYKIQVKLFQEWLLNH